MLAEDSLREGSLEDSLAQLQDQVRKDPSNASYRIFLFQLLVVIGQWERAFTQLKVAGELDASALAMVQTYREALKCEKTRQSVFDGHTAPLVFGKPAQWVALLIEALRHSASGDHAAAEPLRAQAYEMAPATPGRVDGNPFEWIADADSRLGPVLEAIINGNYYWVPFNTIKEIKIEEPVDLRDLVWMPAEITWTNGGGTVALIPTRYPGSEASEDPQIRMSRKTEWTELDADVYAGLGQRMLATDAAEYSLMEARQIELDSVADDDDDGAADG